MNKKMVKYLFRLDDACPTMNSVNWNRILSIFEKYKVKPIIAVIPKNEDQNNVVDTFDNNFWDKVLKWQQSGYHIALHGYNHVYSTTNSGIIGINEFSEFAGVEYNLQKDKIVKGNKFFNDLNINSKIWVAPGHSFDNNTLSILKSNTDINIISDGFAIYPYQSKGFFWLPSQLWGPIIKKAGIWTVCYHPNTMVEAQFSLLESFLLENQSTCSSSVDEIYKEFQNRTRSFADILYWLKVHSLRKVKMLRRKFKS